eukprot:scaffold6802_cov64-Phaeocystis_antarctica.AAC.2
MRRSDAAPLDEVEGDRRRAVNANHATHMVKAHMAPPHTSPMTTGAASACAGGTAGTRRPRSVPAVIAANIGPSTPYTRSVPASTTLPAAAHSSELVQDSKDDTARRHSGSAASAALSVTAPFLSRHARSAAPKVPFGSCGGWPRRRGNPSSSAASSSGRTSRSSAATSTSRSCAAAALPSSQPSRTSAASVASALAIETLPRAVGRRCAT